MASFYDTVIALAPVLWPRFDESSGTVLHDSSTFATHGTIYDPVFGLPSPILTDSSSFAMSGPAGKILIADAPQADVRGNFSIIVFGFVLPADQVQVSHLVTRNGQIGLGGGNWIAIDNGTIRFTLAIDGDDYELDYAVPVREQWYMIEGFRNGAVMGLRINGESVVAPRSDLPLSDISVGGSPAWFFGSSENQNLWWSAGTDEAIIFSPPITEQNGIDIYEAAIGATFLHGRADANPTGILRSTFEPDPISYPFRHNWTETLVERVSFRSAISNAITGVEESVSEMEAPRRELEWTQLVRDDRERRRLRSLLWANQHRKWFIPVRQYAERLLEPLTATTTTTPISTAYKDYEIDSWIGFRQMNDAGEIVHWEERRITSLNPNSVEHEPLAHDYAAYLSIVYPVRRGLLRAQLSVKGHTDAVEELTLTARLLPEDESIIPNRITPFSPTIKYRDVEVFDGRVWQSNDWSEEREYEIERGGEEIDFNTGLIGFESDTVGASETFSYRMTLSGIDNIAAFLGWYYERVGALRYVWVPSMQRDFDLLSVNNDDDQITVRDTNYSNAYALAEPRRDLAFVYWNGSVSLRRVIAFEVSESDEILTLDADVPTTTNLRFISLLKYCRLDADQIELAWQTDNVVQVAWRFREPMMTPEGVGRSSLSPSASLSGSVSPSGSASPSSSLSHSPSPSLSPSPSASISPSHSISPSSSGSPSHSASSSTSASTSPSSSTSPSV